MTSLAFATRSLPATRRAEAVLRDALGAGCRRVLVRGTGRGAWARRLRREGHDVVAGGVADAVLACEELTRSGRPHRTLAEWLSLLRPGGRVVVVETARPRCGLRRPSRKAPFRAGLRPEEALTFLSLADVWDLRLYDLGAGRYLVRGRKP